MPVSKEMIDMMDLPCEDWMHEITLSSELDDVLFGSFQNGAGLICEGRGAGPNPIQSGLSPLAKMGSACVLRDDVQSVMKDWFRGRMAHTILSLVSFTNNHALCAPPGYPCSPPSSNQGDL